MCTHLVPNCSNQTATSRRPAAQSPSRDAGSCWHKHAESAFPCYLLPADAEKCGAPLLVVVARCARSLSLILGLRESAAARERGTATQRVRGGAVTAHPKPADVHCGISADHEIEERNRSAKERRAILLSLLLGCSSLSSSIIAIIVIIASHHAAPLPQHIIADCCGCSPLAPRLALLRRWLY